MGESSARQMRGTELDDIIFAGTDARPSRNIAEITLNLDNQMKKAPAEYNQYDELEITRKVERGKGSSFQINGKPARARDIQLLFADSATGARSAGIVSQGRIGAIVGAKPEDRRTLIEEAANIKGLHQRRHEAELRLRNTESNLERVEDMIAQLAEQRQQLAKQARQAARYRSVADRIRKAEAKLALARWQHIEAQSVTADADLSEQQKKVAEVTAISANAATRQAEIAATLPPLRNAEAEQAARVQTLRIELGECDREAERISDALQRLDRQIAQITSDAERESSLHEDAATALKGLNEERNLLVAKSAQDAPRMEAASKIREEKRATSQQAEQQAAEAQTRLATAERTRNQLIQRQEELERRLKIATEEMEKLNLVELGQAAAQAETEKNTAEQAAAGIQASLKACEDELAQKTTLRDSMAQARNEADAGLARITAEIDALSYLLLENAQHTGTPAADSLTVAEGMELALSVVLGADLALPFDQGEQGYWRRDLTEAEAPQTPSVGTPLTDLVSGAPGLTRALQGVSVIDEAEGDAAQALLKPGQALVSKSGMLWRWDGLIRKGEASSEAERIRQRQRVLELTEELGTATTTRNAAEQKLQSSEELCHETRGERASLLEAAKRLQTEETDARRRAEQASAALQNARTREVDLQQIRADALQDRTALMGDVQTDDDLSALEQKLEACENTARACRATLDNAASTEAELAQAIHAATARKTDIARQQQDWQTRLSQTAQRRSEMTARRAAAQQEMDTLSQRPTLIKGEQDKVTTLQEAAEIARQEKADALRSAEEKTQALTTSQRESERLLTAARETGIRAEGTRERCEADLEVIRERIAEKLDCAPAQLDEIAGLKDGASDEPIDTLEARVTRLHNERDQIGPVNLRAEVEMAEIDSRVTEMQTEKDDLVEAIAKLRSAISTLNKEGRARLLASFNDVNKYFTELFKTLFGGGHAELRLTESDDPLLAGIEILASPPGKKMQSLSLLSGGEQALTALAIIFAVFLTNPAPICILDEVDAPLDDSNVARFCDLLRDIAQRTQTRFLVVTHHRMTMARMDRLFGVTMEQKGISRLVSVDLQTAEEMRDPVMGHA